MSMAYRGVEYTDLRRRYYDRAQRVMGNDSSAAEYTGFALDPVMVLDAYPDAGPENANMRMNRGVCRKVHVWRAGVQKEGLEIDVGFDKFVVLNDGACVVES